MQVFEWVKNHGGEPIIPFSGVFESKLVDMPDDERDKYCKEVCPTACASHLVLQAHTSFHTGIHYVCIMIILIKRYNYYYYYYCYDTLQVLYWQARQTGPGSTQHASVHIILASTSSAHHMVLVAYDISEGRSMTI